LKGRKRGRPAAVEIKVLDKLKQKEKGQKNFEPNICMAESWVKERGLVAEGL